MQLQKALHDPGQGIRVLSSEMISPFLNTKSTFIYFLTTNARLELAQPHTIHNHASMTLVEVPNQCLQSKRAKKKTIKCPLQKKDKPTMLDDFKVGGENEMRIFPLTLTF